MGQRKRLSVRESGILRVDKARGVSSHDVVAMARRVFGTHSVGHAGTLDPMATGILVLGIGEGTKVLRFLENDSKRYRATISLGKATDSWDADGEVMHSAPVQDMVLADISHATRRFVGEHVQRAPAVSAIKRGGEALYKKVRRGEKVEGPLRDVIVHELIVESYEAHSIVLTVHAGKGFYVRSLAHELAQELGTVGHLTALNRLQSGAFSLAGALPMGVLMSGRSGDESAIVNARTALTPLADAVQFLGSIVLDEVGVEHVRHGRVFGPEHVLRKGAIEKSDAADAADGSLRSVFDQTGEVLAVVRMSGDGYRVVRGFVSSSE